MNTRTPRWLLPAVAGLILLVAAITALSVESHHDSSGAGGHSPSSTLPTFAPAPSGQAGFGLPTIDAFGTRLDTPINPAGIALAQDPGTRPNPALGPQYLTAAPAGVMWQRGWNAAALPFSGSDGPTRVVDGIASGFADTPQGAGLAAWDAFARALAAPDGVWQRVLTQRFAGGGAALRDRFAHSRADNPDVGRNVVVPAGFRIHPDYRPDFATVDVAVRTPEQISYGTWAMVWVDGDWRVRVDDIDSLWAPATAVASLADFGVWQ